MSALTDPSPYVDHSRSSKSALYGLPAAVGSIFQIKTKMTSILEVASQEYQKEVRDSARLLWGAVADTIYVAYDLDTESIRIFSTHPDSTKLEYGDEDNPPKPVLRNAAFSAQEKFANKVSELIKRVTK